jgi:hypothetical protein
MFLLRHDSPQIAIDGVHTTFDLLPTNAPFAVEHEEERWPVPGFVDSRLS